MITQTELIKAIKIIESYREQVPNYQIFPNCREFKARRMSLGMSMQDVLNSTGILKSTISRLENSKKVSYDAAKILNDFYVSKGE